jgi:hypothetical protein
MLYLNPPYWVINGISLFPDHADPAQYYFLPMMPHLTTRPDSGVDVPQIQLIEFRGRAGGGGFLNCDVDLGVPPGLLDDTAGELKTQAKLAVTPRLAPVPVVDGTVRMLLLGAQSTVPTDPSGKAVAVPGDPPRFVIKMQSAGRPSLYGDENATFSVQLDQDGTSVVDAALRGELSPIGVVYSLDFFALRPAFSVKANVDWNRVQTHLDEHFTVDVLFFSSDVDTQIDKLIEDRTIDIQADLFVVPESDDTKSIAAQFEQAKSEVREMVKSTFFESSILPPKPGEPDGWDKAAAFANEISRLAVTGGASSFGGLSYKKVDLTRIDKKTLTFSFRERTTVRKTIWPQGHLGGLFRLSKTTLPLDRFIVPADIDKPYFQRRKVQVISRADFDGDGIQSIDVALLYGGQPQTAMLEPGTDRQSVDWASVLDGSGAMVRPVGYDYRVTFKSADRSQRPVALDTRDLPARPSTVEDQLEIVPRDLLYAIADVPISCPFFPWDRYPQVDVECRYVDAANQIQQDQLFRLTQAAPGANFRMFLRDPTRRGFDFRVTFHGADGKDLYGLAGQDPAPAWTSANNEQVLVRDPFPAKRQLMVVPQVDWTVVNHVFVDLSYQDGPAAGDEIDQSLEFTAADAGSKTFAFNPKNPDQKLIAYEVTMLTKAGAPIKVPRSFTADRRLIVRADMRGHRVIAVAPAVTPFAPAHVVVLAVDLRYVDAGNGLSFSDHFDFHSPADHGTFEFDYVDPARSGYEYKVTASYDNGLSREGDWAAESADALTLPVA